MVEAFLVNPASRMPRNCDMVASASALLRHRLERVMTDHPDCPFEECAPMVIGTINTSLAAGSAGARGVTLVVFD